VHDISTLKVLLTKAVYVTCRMLLKIVKLANFSGEAIFPTLFQVFKTIRLRKFRSNCSRNENVLKLPRHGVYDILKIKSHKKVGVTKLVKKI
jgi:hypothetical protein